MLTFSKFKESSIGQQGRRLLKVFEFGAKTAKEVSSFGVDSNPNVMDMTAIYAKTSNQSENVVIGYIQTNLLAEPGEIRIFSLDDNGAVKSYVWCKKDGKLELNGNAFTSVRFEALDTALQAEVSKINVELGKISAAITMLGGTYVVSPVSVDISGAKSEDVKLK